MTGLLLLILTAGMYLTVKGVNGRAENLGADTRDMFTALFKGDYKSVQSSVAEKSQSPLSILSQDDDADRELNVAGSDVNSAAFLATAVSLGTGAGNRYVMGGTTSRGYDCSGLVWAAFRQTGRKTARFTTASFGTYAKDYVQKVDGAPKLGDIVVWPGVGNAGHMGIATSATTMYAARSTRTGIGTSSIQGTSSQKGYKPTVYRLVK